MRRSPIALIVGLSLSQGTTMKPMNGPTWGDASLSAKGIESAERAIDAVGILKAVGLVGEDGGEIFGVAGLGSGMASTEGGIRVGSNGTTLTSGSGAVLAALRSGVWTGY